MQRRMRSARSPAWLKIGFALTLVLTFGMGRVSADPSTLQVGGNSATGTDPVRIDDSGLVTINEITGSSVTFSSFQLILGIPEPQAQNFSFSNSSILSVSSTSPGATSWSFENNTNAVMTPSDTGKNQDAYSLLGLPSPNSSNNATNWFGSDQTYNKFTPSTFGLYVFDITANLSAKGTVSVQFSSLPVGTYAIVLSQGSDGKYYGTPFTEAGLTTPGGAQPLISTPAPPSAVLLGFGGLGLILILVRSRQRLALA